MKVVYKYRNFKRGVQVLLQQALYFSRPSEFDDRLDSKIEIDYPKNQSEWEPYINRLIPETSSSKILQFRKYLKDIHYSGLRFRFQHHQKIINLHDASIKALSLTSTWRNKYAWGIYADDYHGIALGFKTVNINRVEHLSFEKSNFTTSPTFPILRNGLAPLLGINYEIFSYKRVYKLSTGDYQPITESLLAKNIQYINEQEMRSIILLRNFIPIYDALPSHPVTFDKQSLVEVVIGFNTPPFEQVAIMDLIDLKYPGVRVYKCELDHLTGILRRNRLFRFNAALKSWILPHSFSMASS